jgi:protein-tyrosine phosphatase
MLNGIVARRYALGAAAVAALSYWASWWGLLLLWLALSLAAQAMAYAGLGAVVFRKRNGRLPWSVRILLAPYMICARITLYYYCKGLPAYTEAARGVWIGRRVTNAEASELVAKGVTASLDLTAGFPASEPLRKLAYLNIQLLPLTVPNLDQLREAVRFVDEQSQKGIVYVHGALGYSRSAGVVAAYLLAKGVAASVPDAIERVRRLVPQTLLDEQWTRRLEEFAQGVPRATTVG